MIAILSAACTEPIEWIHIPAGEGLFGLDAPEAYGPQMMVEFPEFWITKREITVGHFEQCPAESCQYVDDDARDAQSEHMYMYFGDRGREYPSCWTDRDVGTNRAQACITHSEARAFAEFMNARLPSEAEWEYVARGGPDQVEWWVECHLASLRGYPDRPSSCDDVDVTPQGVYHMSRGVREMVADQPAVDEDRSQHWPAAFVSANDHERRWILKPGHMTFSAREANIRVNDCPMDLSNNGVVAGRQACDPHISGLEIGFRLVRDTPPPGW